MAIDTTKIYKNVKYENTTLKTYSNTGETININTNANNIDVRGYDTANVSVSGGGAYSVQDYVDDNESCAYLFYYSNVIDLQRIINDLNTTRIDNMSYMFYNCKVTSLEFPISFDTSDVTTMAYMFSGCTDLRTLDISHFDFTLVTNMSGMFNNCQKITSVPFNSNVNFSDVTSLSNLFNGCKAITSIDFSGKTFYPTVNASNMFRSCHNLTSLNLDSFTTAKNINNVTGIFNGCYALQYLDIRSWDISGYTAANIQAMFGTANAGVPNNCEIIVNNQASKNLLDGIRFTNVTVAT